MRLALATITALSLALFPGVSDAKKIVIPMKAQAHIGKVAALAMQPWASANEAIVQSNHVVLHGLSSDEFGSDWWGGGYIARYDFADLQNNGNINLAGGTYLTAFAKLLTKKADVAKVRLGVHNWAGNVTNGEIEVLGKTLKSWYLIDTPINETFSKSMTFWEPSIGYDIGPVSVGLTATVAGNLTLKAFAEMKDLKATMNMEPSAKLTVKAKAGLDLVFAGAYVEGGLDPLIGVYMPVKSWFKAGGKWGPCYDVNADFELRTLDGYLKLVVNYVVNTYEEMLAQWTGFKKTYSLIHLKKSCLPDFVINTSGTGVLSPITTADPQPQPKPPIIFTGGTINGTFSALHN